MSGRQGSIDHDCSGARRGEKVMYIEDCQCRVVSELEKFRCGGEAGLMGKEVSRRESWWRSPCTLR